MFELESCLFLFEFSPLWLCQVGVVDYFGYPGRFCQLNFPSITIIPVDLFYCLDSLRKSALCRRMHVLVFATGKEVTPANLTHSQIALVHFHNRFLYVMLPCVVNQNTLGVGSSSCSSSLWIWFVYNPQIVTMDPFAGTHLHILSCPWRIYFIWYQCELRKFQPHWLWCTK